MENIFEKYCACHEIMTRGHTKCCTGHAKTSSSSNSKNATLLKNRAPAIQNALHVQGPRTCFARSCDMESQNEGTLRLIFRETPAAFQGCGALRGRCLGNNFHEENDFKEEFESFLGSAFASFGSLWRFFGRERRVQALQVQKGL